MPCSPIPTPPAEQVALRRWLEILLQSWNVAYSHTDTFWRAEDGGKSRWGWGTCIQRSPGVEPIEIWYDGASNDLSIWAGNRRRDYREWSDFSDMPQVRAKIKSALRLMLAER